MTPSETKPSDAKPSDTNQPSTDPTPAGDVPTLRELAKDEGGTTEPDEIDAPSPPSDQED